jgi:(2R)-3-sulfolactate dehydrogenase (NADP+)
LTTTVAGSKLTFSGFAQALSQTYRRPMPSLILSFDEVVSLCHRALRAHGASEPQAASLAAAIACAERDGIASHGLVYLPTYCDHLRCGKVDGGAVPTVERPAAAVVTVDAMTGFAHLAIDTGAPLLVAAARKQGVATMAIRNSYNCGVLGYHTERIAESGLLALGFTNAPASIAPSGARKPVLGTNPWSIAAPRPGGAPFVIDQGASVVAKSQVMKRASNNEPIPEGWALDAEGRPTTDAAAGLSGSMVPSGGYKGVGAALLVELMAACLAGATPGAIASPFSGTRGGPPRTGQYFIAIDPGPSSGGLFEDRLATVLGAFVAEPTARLPGSRRLELRTEADRIAVDSALHTRVIALASL